jgi:hypothetical protein
MAHRSASPPRSVLPVSTSEQRRYRAERFRICIERLEAFDPNKVRGRIGVPEVVTLEAGIDNALSATFGYGTPSYFRFNLAARLDSGPLVTSAALESAVLSSVSGPGNYDERAVQEARRYFSKGKTRSIALLQEAIRTLDADLSDARAVSRAPQPSDTAQRALQSPALAMGSAATPVSNPRGIACGVGGGEAVNEGAGTGRERDRLWKAGALMLSRWVFGREG